MTCSAMAFFPPNFMLQNPHGDDEEDHPQPPSLHAILSSSTLEHFHAFSSPIDLNGGVSSYLNKRALMPLSKIDICHEVNGEDESWDDGIQVGEKKRRLNREQVKTLEKSFEMGNKLEPARKMDLARAVGLQPRQIAIWFQNRRARWKIKQLEKDYNLLKRQFEAVKADNHALQAHNHQLHAEIMALKSNKEPTESINLNKETEGSCSENSSHIKLEISTTIHHSHSSNNHQSRGPPFLSSPPHHNPSSGIPYNSIDDQSAKEQSLSNMYIGIDDQSGFWPWLEQHHFN